MTATTADAPDVSVIIPVYNEQGNIFELCDRLSAALAALPSTFEVIVVDDGSSDASAEELRVVASRDNRFKVVRLRRNFGQTAALMAGIDFARGRTFVFIDADLQNDPADIPLLLEKLDEGWDVVSGWRKDRKDAALSRVLPSRIANLLISWVSGVKLHDYGCTLKAYRRDALFDVKLYGEMHRFIPIYAKRSGARITEVPVQHHPRVRGDSKYGLARVLKVLLDLAVVKFLDRSFAKPIYVFGGFGLLSILAGLVTASYMIFLKLFENVSMILTPLPLLSALFVMLGVMAVLMGLLAEMLVRIYFESQNRRDYAVRELLNLGEAH